MKSPIGMAYGRDGFFAATVVRTRVPKFRQSADKSAQVPLICGQGGPPSVNLRTVCPGSSIYKQKPAATVQSFGGHIFMVIAILVTILIPNNPQ